jgi:NAD(P)-dependent dehydrogenase (short-subunit alcohol dehydrogenase family)
MARRNIVITGGFGALGSVVANAFTRQGDAVARIDFAPSVAGNGDMFDLPGIDLTQPEACAAAVETICERFGGIDALINITGGFAWQTLEDGDLAAWQRMYALNVLTAATMIKASLPVLKASSAGRIVNIGAGGAIHAAAGMGAYAAAKAGVHRLTESLAAELSDTSVTVNAILPSIIDTPANRADMPDADTSQWVQAQAIADVILFLTSDAARAINGALLPVTRGTPV